MTSLKWQPYVMICLDQEHARQPRTAPGQAPKQTLAMPHPPYLKADCSQMSSASALVRKDARNSGEKRSSTSRASPSLR